MSLIRKLKLNIFSVKSSSNGETFSIDIWVFFVHLLIASCCIEGKYRKKTGSHQSLLCSCSKRITQPVAFYITGVWLPSAVKHRVRCNKVGWWIAFLISLNPWKENWPGGWRFFLLGFNRVGIQSVWQANNDTVRPRRKEAGCQWSNPGGRLRGAGRLVSGWFRSPSWLRWQLRVQKAANRMRLRPRGHVAPARITSGQKKVKRLDSKQSLLF